MRSLHVHNHGADLKRVQHNHATTARCKGESEGVGFGLPYGGLGGLGLWLGNGIGGGPIEPVQVRKGLKSVGVLLSTMLYGGGGGGLPENNKIG